jgi:hypothetical protein
MLVDALVDAVRSQIDEENNENITPRKLLDALNRGQRKLVRLAARHYPTMFMKETTVPAAGRDITLPAEAFGWSINEVDVIQAGQAYKVMACQLRQLTTMDSTSSTASIPIYYAQIGNAIKLFPVASDCSLRIRFQRRPPDLVVQQGRITTVDDTNTQVYLDAVGSDLTTSIAQLNAFVNWIDGTTGLVKATLQVASINTAQKLVAFKTTGLDRTTVYGQTVSTALPADAAQDDYLCLAQGTCVPTLVQDYADYLIQFAVVELKRKTAEPTQEEYAALKELEDDIKSMWGGREGTLRVARANPYWGQKIPLIQRYR